MFHLFADFPPECNVLEGSGTVQDNLDSCYSTIIKCEDPQGGFVNYTSTSELFDLYSNANGSLDLCPAMDLHNKSGIYEVKCITYLQFILVYMRYRSDHHFVFIYHIREHKHK